MRILLCQVSQHLLLGAEGNIATRYFDKLYEVKQQEGYYRPYHFWEIPLWAAELNGSLNGIHTDFEVIDEEGFDLEKLKQYDWVCMSAINVNVEHIESIVEAYPEVTFALGYYDDEMRDRFKSYGNVHMFATIQQFVEHLGQPYMYNVNYDLFRGVATIPRLSLSEGCLYNCKFCSISNKLVLRSRGDMIKQVTAFLPLNFKLVYVDDKSFGQAQNYTFLKQAYTLIRMYNPDFQGFIVQTNVAQFYKNPDFGAELVDMGVKYVELGIETFDDGLYKRYKKPQNKIMVQTALDILNSHKINVIGNFIVGMEGETTDSYYNTLELIENNQWSHLNIYNLTVYDNTVLATEFEINEEDKVKRPAGNRSFHTEPELHEWFHDEIYKLGIKILEKNGI